MCAWTGTPRPATGSSAGIRSPLYKDRRDKEPFPLVSTTRNDQPFPQRRVQLEPVFGSSMINERWLATATRRSSSKRSTGPASARQWLTDTRRAADRRAQSDRLGQRPHVAWLDCDRLGHPRQDLPDQRESDLGHGPPHVKFGGQSCTTTNSASTRGTTGCSGSSTSTARLPVSRSPTSCSNGVEQGRGGGDPNDPWTHLQNRISVFAQDDFKVLRK